MAYAKGWFQGHMNWDRISLPDAAKVVELVAAVADYHAKEMARSVYELLEMCCRSAAFKASFSGLVLLG